MTEEKGRESTGEERRRETGTALGGATAKLSRMSLPQTTPGQERTITPIHSITRVAVQLPEAVHLPKGDYPPEAIRLPKIGDRDTEAVLSPNRDTEATLLPKRWLQEEVLGLD